MFGGRFNDSQPSALSTSNHSVSYLLISVSCLLRQGVGPQKAPSFWSVLSKDEGHYSICAGIAVDTDVVVSG